VLEVTQPAGRKVFLKLVKNCDIVTDNFRPGTMRRFGFDHETLAAINPRIITLSSTAYGYTGPWRSAGSRARTSTQRAACLP
jgi:crotonobetainyl-CoA:carnitine CoA-transferase CaiB-like acyl-CoA transferase